MKHFYAWGALPEDEERSREAAFFFWGGGGGPRLALFCALMSIETQVRAAHGRVLLLKPISNNIFVLLANKNWKCFSVIGKIQQSLIVRV